MAPLPVILQPGLLQVKPQYTSNPDTGDKPEHVLWFVSATTGTSPSSSQLLAMAAAFDPAWGTLFHNYGAQAHSYLGSQWTDYSTAFGLSNTSVGTFAPVVGTQGNSMASQVAILISLHIQERYRGGHGRIYLPWVGVGNQAADNNQITTAQQTILQGNFGQINAATTASGVLGGQSQRVYRNRTGKSGTPHLQPIANFSVQLTLATQRRRIRRAAHH